MKKFNLLIPGWLKKLDKKLLYRSPQLWVTKIHYALFYSLVLAGILYGLTRLFDVDLTYELSNPWNAFSMMIIPGLGIFFWWFVLQAQYNVDKNFGRLSLLHDYQNFFSYLIIIAAFFVVMLSVPIAQIHNVRAAVPLEKLAEDVYHLDTGVSYFREGFHKEADGRYTVDAMEYIYLGWSHSEIIEQMMLDNGQTEDGQMNTSCSEYLEERNTPHVRIVTRDRALTEIIQFKETYNKYTSNKITDLPEKILDFPGYIELHDYDQQSVDSKVEQLLDYSVGGYGRFISEWMIKALAAVAGFLALLTWIFKNVHWKNYLAAGVTSLLSPLFIGLTGLLLFDIIRIHYSKEEVVIFTIIAAIHSTLIVLAIAPLIKRKYSWLGVVCTILIQFWTPIFIFIYGTLIFNLMQKTNDFGWGYDERDQVFHLLYYSGWIFVVASLWLFKKYYALMWAQPKSK